MSEQHSHPMVNIIMLQSAEHVIKENERIAKENKHLLDELQHMRFLSLKASAGWQQEESRNAILRDELAKKNKALEIIANHKVHSYASAYQLISIAKQALGMPVERIPFHG